MPERKWRGKRVGDASDAGAACGTTAASYRYYVRRLGAPGPVTSFPNDSGRFVSFYDLDAVAAWHAARPGRGYRSDLDRVEG